jgi:hypothetical protein
MTVDVAPPHVYRHVFSGDMELHGVPRLVRLSFERHSRHILSINHAFRAYLEMDRIRVS